MGSAGRARASTLSGRVILAAAALLLSVFAPDLGIALGARLAFHLAGWDGGSAEQVRQAERRLAAVQGEMDAARERAKDEPPGGAAQDRVAGLSEEVARAKLVLERLSGEPPPPWAKRALRIALVLGPVPCVLYLVYGWVAAARRSRPRADG